MLDYWKKERQNGDKVKFHDEQRKTNIFGGYDSRSTIKNKDTKYLLSVQDVKRHYYAWAGRDLSLSLTTQPLHTEKEGSQFVKNIAQILRMASRVLSA